MISGQSLTCPKGTSLTFEIDMDTGSDLTGATAQWALAESWFDQAKVYLTKTGTGDGLFIGQDAGIWKITVNLAPSDTLDVPSGLLYHDCKVLLQSGDVEDVANGPFSLDPSVNILDTNAPITRNVHALQALGRPSQVTTLTVGALARNLLATQTLSGLGQSVAGTVTGGSSLAFSADFTSISSLPSQISFSRASNAMVYNSTGKLTYAPNNLLKNSNDLTSADWSKSGVSVTPGVADPLGGTAASTITATVTDGELVQTLFSQPPGMNWVGAIWARRRTGSGSVTFYNPDDTVASVTLTSSWQQFSCSSPTRIVGSVYLDIVIHTSGDAIDIYAPTLSLVTYETTARSVDQIITGASVYYGPRFDHSWNGSAWAASGLLIEEQRTNILMQSNNFTDGAHWNNIDTTVAASGNNSPDGTADAFTLTVPSVASKYAYNAMFSVASGTYTCSMWARVTTGTGKLYIGLQSDSLVELTCSLTTSWARFSVSYTHTSGTLYFVVGQKTDGSTTDASPNVEVFGAQVELGSFATSYIPTTTAAVTRSADIAQLTGAAQTALHGAGYSIVVHSKDSLSPGLINWTQFLYLYHASTSLNRGSLFGPSGSSVTTIVSQDNESDNHNLSSTPLSTGTLNAEIQMALATDGAGRSLALNGGTVTSDAFQPAGGFTTAFLGSSGGDSYSNMHVARLAIYNTRLSDADLQTKSVVGASF